MNIFVFTQISKQYASLNTALFKAKFPIGSNKTLQS